MKSTAVKNPNYPLILLAGGMSKRMRHPKALLDYKGLPWIQQQLMWLKPSIISRVIVVLGHKTDIPIDKATLRNEGLHVQTEVNQTPEYGPFSSLVCGLKSIANSKFKAVFVSPIDVPCYDFSTWTQLIEAQQKQAALAALPEYEKKGGHPVLLSTEFVKDLIHVPLSSDLARLDKQLHLRASESIVRVKINNPCVVENLNTPEDWASFLKKEL